MWRIRRRLQLQCGSTGVEQVWPGKPEQMPGASASRTATHPAQLNSRSTHKTGHAGHTGRQDTLAISITESAACVKRSQHALDCVAHSLLVHGFPYLSTGSGASARGRP